MGSGQNEYRHTKSTNRETSAHREFRNTLLDCQVYIAKIRGIRWDDDSRNIY